jgi:FkbM family methyltransferase
MLGKVLVKTGALLCRYRDAWPITQLNRAIEILYFKIENDNATLESNGEFRVISCLQGLQLTVFVDVGANRGVWSLAVSKRHPEGKIFAFEASPVTFVWLKNNLAGTPAVTMFNLGLYNSEGTLDFMQNDDDGLSSLIPTKENADAEKMTVEVTTIDDFVRDQKLTHIDFLKIDTEGADYAVLQGAVEMLRAGKINIIQFEYGFVSVDTKNLLKDYYELLTTHGYVVGKIYPSSVEFRDYDRTMENFIGPNFIAVKKERRDIIDALR